MLLIATWLSLATALLIQPSHAAISGHVGTVDDDYPYHLSSVTRDFDSVFDFEMSDKDRISRRWRFQWKLWAQSNITTHSRPENFDFDIPEGFFEYKGPWGVKTRIGVNTLNWGVVDISSPSDSIHPVMMFNPLRPRKLGSPMVEFLFGEDSLKADLVYVPMQQQPRLPSEDSRWLPRSFLIDSAQNNVSFSLPENVEYVWDKPVQLNRAEYNNFGGKLSSHLGSVDLQATYFQGASSTPKAIPTRLSAHFVGQDLVAYSPIHLTAENYLIETTGIGFTWALSNWIFRGESAYQNSLTKDQLIEPWSWSNVLGAETNVNLGTTTTTLIAQYFYAKHPIDSDNLISNSYRLFDRTVLLGARISLSEKWTSTLSALSEANGQGLFAMAGIENKLNDALTWKLIWRDFSAGREGLIKTFEHNDFGSFELWYYF